MRDVQYVLHSVSYVRSSASERGLFQDLIVSPKGDTYVLRTNSSTILRPFRPSVHTGYGILSDRHVVVAYHPEGDRILVADSENPMRYQQTTGRVIREHERVEMTAVDGDKILSLETAAEG
jgi:hypothetical protein